MVAGVHVYQDAGVFGVRPHREKYSSRKSRSAVYENPPRIAFFTDCFHEVNGVALTSRHLTSFARQNELPFLAVYCGKNAGLPEDEHPLALPLARGFATIPVERDFGFDP